MNSFWFVVIIHLDIQANVNTNYESKTIQKTTIKLQQRK